MHQWNGMWGMGWGMLLGWAALLAFVLIVVWVLARFARIDRGKGESAEEVLARRYAGGEIDRETYHRMLEDLRSAREE